MTGGVTVDVTPPDAWRTGIAMSVSISSSGSGNLLQIFSRVGELDKHWDDASVPVIRSSWFSLEGGKPAWWNFLAWFSCQNSLGWIFVKLLMWFSWFSWHDALTDSDPRFFVYIIYICGLARWGDGLKNVVVFQQFSGCNRPFFWGPKWGGGHFFWKSHRIWVRKFDDPGPELG